MSKDIIEVIKERLEMLRDRGLLCVDEYRALKILVGKINLEYIKLPVDAHGEPIKPGDFIKYNDLVSSVRFMVEAYEVVSGELLPSNGTVYYLPYLCTHDRPETIESLLKKFASFFCDLSTYKDDEVENTIAEYAEKIKAVD